MIDRPDVIDQLVDVRDVLESYKCCKVTPLNWYKTLSTAARIFGSLSGDEGYGVNPDLVNQLTIIMEHGLEEAPRALSAAAEDVALALSENVIPGIPLPEDESWEFQEPTAS